MVPANAAAILDIDTEDGREIITLSLPDTSSHKVFDLDNPDRLVVDVPSLPNRPAVSLPRSYEGRLIKSVRFGQFTPETARFVFDLSQRVKIENVEEGDGKLVITIRAPKEQKRHKPDKPTIVIDPGHGGIDPGTIGRSGMKEKNLVLDYARALKTKLLKTGRYHVLLTRDGDEFIMLRKRFEIARKAQADLFISLHADSAPDKVNGLSVYTLSEKSSDEETEALAARENKSDVLAGVDLSDERDDVAGILISLAARETKNDSATLADLLVTSLQEKIELLPNSHRFAGFAVLKAPDVPSVLIETGFLSNPSDERLLKSKAYRDKVVSGIADAVDAYFRLQKKFGAQ